MPLLRFRPRRGRGRLDADTHRLALGGRVTADAICPAAVEVERDHLVVDDAYLTALSIDEYPRRVGAGWLMPLTSFREPAWVSMHISPTDTDRAIRGLDHKLTHLRRIVNKRREDDRNIDWETETAVKDTLRVQEALQVGDEGLYSVATYLLTRGESPAALRARTRRLKRALDHMLARGRRLFWRQDLGLRSCLPLGEDHLRHRRNIDASGLALGFPFVDGSFSMHKGVFYGRALHNDSVVIFDPFDESLAHANMAIFAPPGRGKSYFTKAIAARLRVLGIRFFFIDPEEKKEEYRRICLRLGGSYARLRPGGRHAVNPLDLPPVPVVAVDDSERTDPLTAAIEDMEGLLEIMLAEPGRGLTTIQRALLQRALIATYAGAGILPGDRASWQRPAPLLGDLHARLVALGGDEAHGPLARDLALGLEPFVVGPLSSLLNRPTNIDLDNPFVVFNVSALAAKADPRRLAIGIHLITRFVWHRIQRAEGPTVLGIDEGWSLLQQPAGGRFIQSMARRLRKYWGGLIFISQFYLDCANDPNGQILNGCCEMKFFMGQEGGDNLEAIVRDQGLTADGRQFLLAAGKGEGLFFVRNNHVAMKAEASPKLHQEITTAPREVAAAAARAGGGAALAADAGA